MSQFCSQPPATYPLESGAALQSGPQQTLSVVGHLACHQTQQRTSPVHLDPNPFTALRPSQWLMTHARDSLLEDRGPTS